MTAFDNNSMDSIQNPGALAAGSNTNRGRRRVPDQVIASLQSVIADIDDYLSGWLARFERELATSANASSSTNEQQHREKEFQKEKAAWEAQRQREARQMEMKATQLSDAWLRLEAEQREFQRMADSQRLATRDSASASVTPKRGVAASGREDVHDPNQTVERAGIAEADAGRITSRPLYSDPEKSAVRQFNQLKREIESRRPSQGSL